MPTTPIPKLFVIRKAVKTMLILEITDGIICIDYLNPDRCKLAAYDSPKSDTLYRHSRSVHSL